MSLNSLLFFASGTGSNFRAIYSAIESKKLDAICLGLVSDQPQAPVLDFAREKKIKTMVCPREKINGKYISRAEHEKMIEQQLATHFGDHFSDQIDWVVLCGYMRIFSENFLKKFSFQKEKTSNYTCKYGLSADVQSQAVRMINIHPSLLPEFKGLDAYGQAFAARVKKTGATVHLVCAEMDAGPILAQSSFVIDSDCARSIQTLRKRGLENEHALYASTLDALFRGKLRIS